MRLISQNKQVDVPYEHVYLSVEGGYICARFFPVGQNLLMAEYENYSALSQALHDLQVAYTAGDKYFHFP